MVMATGLRVLLGKGADHLDAYLGARGHWVSCCPDEQSAIRTARSRAQDVVILDLDVHEDDPFQLARSIRAATLWRKPLFVALSQADAFDDSACSAAGFDLLLLKPVEPAQLASFLGRFQAVVDEYESFDPMI
ncbi:MAG: hypothetical protein U0840_20130 [Gemmataceae bacterium]